MMIMGSAIGTNDEHSNKASPSPSPSPESRRDSDAVSNSPASEQGVNGSPLATALTEDDLPGLRSWSGRDIVPEDVHEVIGLLDKAGVPACVVDVYALRYYGAGRISNEWNICVPHEKLDIAADVFKKDCRFAPVRPVSRLHYSLLHTRPTFTMTGVGFYFILEPSSDCFIDPSPDRCELSGQGIPYPKMHHFARSLLLLQNERCNLNDFIDGMNLDKKWAESNLDFDNLQVHGLKFTRELNVKLKKEGLGQFNLDVDYRSLWHQSVDEKDKRIEPMKQGRYKTRWRRINNDTDPRLRDRPF